MICDFSEFGRQALARYEARAKESGLDHIAAFAWSEARGVYEVEVCGLIVASVRTVREVRAFCLMHNREF